MAVNNITIQILIQAQQAQQQVNNFNQALGQMGAAAQKAGAQGSQGISSVTVAVNSASKAIEQMTAALAGLAAVRLIGNMMETADAINRVAIGFKAMTGSAMEARTTMAQLREVAAGSPFGFQQIADGARQLQAFGFATKEIPRDIKAITEAVKTIGGGSEEIEQLTYALGIMREKGVAQAQQLFRQIAARGIDVMRFIREQLQQETGQILTDTQIRNLMAKGRLAGEATAEVILRGLDKIPKSTQDMMELTTSHLQKMKDEWGFLAQKIIEDIGPELAKFFDGFRDFMNYLELHSTARGISEWVVGLSSAMIGIAAVARAFQALKLGEIIGGMIELIKDLTVALGGLEAILLAVAAAIAAAGLIAAYRLTAPKKDDQPPGWIESAKGVYGLGMGMIAGAGAGIRSAMGIPPSGIGVHDVRTPEATAESVKRMNDEEEKRLKILQAQTELIHSQDEESQKILARAKEADTRGLPAISARFDETIRAMESAAKEVFQGVDPAARARVEEARQITINTFIRQQEEKAVQARLEADKRYLSDRLELVKANTQTESEMALATIQDTADARAAAERNQLDIQIKGAEEARQIRRQMADVDYQIASTKTEEFIARELELNKANQEQITRLHKLAADMRADDDEVYRANKAKADIEAERDTLEAIAAMSRKAASDTTQRIQQAKAVEDQAQIQSAEAQIAIARFTYENGEAQNARQKIAAIKASTQFEMTAADQLTNLKRQQREEELSSEYDAALKNQQDLLNKGEQLYADSKFAESAMAFRAAQDQADNAVAIQKQFYAEDSALFQENQDAKTLMALRAQKEANDAWISEQKQVFEKFEEGVGKVFDTLFEKGKSFWDRMKDLVLDTGKQMLKALIVPQISAALMSGMGMPVHLESTGDFGSGQIAQFARMFTMHPVFQKLPQSALDLELKNTGSIPVRDVSPKPRQYNIHSDSSMRIEAPPQGYQPYNFPVVPSPDITQQSSQITATMLDDSGNPIGAPAQWTTPGYTTGGGVTYGAATGGAGLAGLGGILGLPALGGFGGGGYGGGGGGTGLGGILGTLQGAAQISQLGQLGGAGAGGGPGLGGLLGQAKGIASLASGGWKAALSGLAPGLGLMGAMAGLGGAFHLGQYAQRTGSPIAGAAAPLLGAFSGLLAAGSLAALFPSVFVPLLAAGPIGWIAAAGIGAAIGLIGVLKKSDTQHVRDLVKQMYGIDISNVQVLNQIVQIAKQKYGGAISIAVASPEVQQLVNLYAASQGMRSVGPRPMYAATLNQSAAGLQLQPVYSNGQLVSSPYAGTTTTQWALASQYMTQQPSAMYLQLDPALASQLFSGQVVNVLNQNPTVVGNANSAAISSGSSRNSQLGGLLEPFTVHA